MYHSHRPETESAGPSEYHSLAPSLSTARQAPPPHSSPPTAPHQVRPRLSHTPTPPSLYGGLAPSSSHHGGPPSSYHTAPSPPSPAPSRAQSSLFGAAAGQGSSPPPARYRPPSVAPPWSNRAPASSLSPLPGRVFSSSQAPSPLRSTPLFGPRISVRQAAASYEDSRAGDFPDLDEGDISNRSSSQPTRLSANIRPPSYPSMRGHDKELEDEALGEWATYEAPYNSGWTGAGGDGLQHLGVGFTPPKGISAPNSLGSAAGGRAGRIAERRERLERKYGKTGEPGDEPEPLLSVEDQVRLVEERKRRTEEREVEWSGADAKGRLAGGKGRGALRWLQMLLVFGVAFGAIGATLLTSPTTPPPQKTKPMTYALYLLPFVSLAVSLYLFAIRPCMYRRRSIQAAMSPTQPGMNGISVIPLIGQQQTPSSGGCCGRRGGKPPPGFSKKDWAQRQAMMGGGGAPPTVNLLVDSAPFTELLRQSQAAQTAGKNQEKRRRAREKRKRRLAIEARRAAAEVAGQPLHAEEGEDAWGSDTSSSSDEDSDEEDEDLPTSRERQIAMHKWSQARAWARKLVAVDIVSGVLWVLVVTAAIFLNGTCPTGGYDGWCNYYNLGLAMAVLSAVVSWTSAALGVVDLGKCKLPPLGLPADPNQLRSNIAVPWQ